MTSSWSFAEPIAQDLAYHRFADTRAWWGLPNAADVLSNLFFVVVGVAGLVWLARHAGARRWMWVMFFVGVTLTGFGSGWYHLQPGNETLVWDRLPMAVAFMAFLAALIADRVSDRGGAWLFGPLLVLGVGSVVYWHYTDDLRPYALVQFGPLLVMPLLLARYPARQLRTSDVLLVLGWYVLAKVLERADARVFALDGGVVSGHTLKHIAAAAGCGWVLRALMR